MTIPVQAKGTHRIYYFVLFFRDYPMLFQLGAEVGVGAAAALLAHAFQHRPSLEGGGDWMQGDADRLHFLFDIRQEKKWGCLANGQWAGQSALRLKCVSQFPHQVGHGYMTMVPDRFDHLETLGVVQEGGLVPFGNALVARNFLVRQLQLQTEEVG